MDSNEAQAIDMLINEIADVVVEEYCTHCKVCDSEEKECIYTQAIDTVYKLTKRQEDEIVELKEKNAKLHKLNVELIDELLKEE